MGTVTLGIDIGQKHDPTAIAVAEMEWRAVGGRTEDHYVVRYLQRLPLGAEYPAITARLGEVVGNVRKRGVPVGGVYVDATGVGQPVVDQLKGAGLRITPTYFTHGDRRKENEDGSITLGKAYLVSRLKVLMQTDRVHLPETDEMEAMQRELAVYEIRVDEQANDRYGAFKVGTHDDLVTALGLAVQKQPNRPFEAIAGPPRPTYSARQ